MDTFAHNRRCNGSHETRARETTPSPTADGDGDSVDTHIHATNPRPNEPFHTASCFTFFAIRRKAQAIGDSVIYQTGPPTDASTNRMSPVAASPTKKCPPSIRTTSVPMPVLVSPISVAHGSTIAGSEGGKKGANWMRDQWVANLKKKRMGGGYHDVHASVTSAGTVPVVKAGIRAETSRPVSEKAPANRPKRTAKSRHAKAASSDAMANAAAVDKDSLSLMSSAMFFNDLGCFELESPSFMRLTPTMRDGLFGPLPSPTPYTKTEKKGAKPVGKKRSNSFAAELHSEPLRKHSTPRRLQHGGSFDESDTSSQHSYTSVGTPSNFSSADAARMWGPELDLSNGYVDTFLDLPTPRVADLPSVGGTYVLSTPTALSLSKRPDDKHELAPPRLIRTSSIEQEGLSHVLEQTSLGRSASDGAKSSRPHGGFWTPRQAASSAVDDYFGRIAPSPANAYAFSNGRCFQPTPKGTLRLQHSTREYNFDPKKASSRSSSTPSTEFDTLVQEYEFTDFDQELDTFYLDSIESFGNETDLISS